MVVTMVRWWAWRLAAKLARRLAGPQRHLPAVFPMGMYVFVVTHPRVHLTLSREAARALGRDLLAATGGLPDQRGVYDAAINPSHN